MNERLDWFKARVGQRIFRNKIDGIEDTQYLKGIVVMSEKHAKGLYDLEAEYILNIKYVDESEISGYYDTKSN